MRLSEEEKAELLATARSASLRADMQSLRARDRAPLDFDRYIEFATVCNAFANHARKPFRRIIDDRMIL